METFWLAMASMIGFMFALVVLFAIMVRKRPGGNSNVQPAPAPAAPAAGGGASGIMQSAWNALNSRLAVTLVAIACLGVLGWALVSFMPELPGVSAVSNLSLPVVLSGIAVIVLAILGALGKAGKGGKWGLFLLASVATFFIVREIFWAHEYGNHAKEVVAIQQQQEAAEEIADQKEKQLRKGGVTELPAWEGAKDGALPVGVWSAAVVIQPGCSIRFSGGHGVLYETQYRYYEDTWHDQELNSSPNMNEVRFKILKEGVTELPYKLKCS